jgi:RNA polymerase sigma-70 factor (ECF subfamily)
VGDAEDVVQDVWLRWQGTDRTVVLDPPAYLVTTTTRLAINVVQSARKRHEKHAGPIFHKLVDSSAGPEEGAERRDAIEMALYVLMEKLTPAERAAYLLREAFAYPYRKISEVLRLSVANTRQLVRRARQRLAAERRAPVNSASHRRLVQAFLAAAQTGELAYLEQHLAAEVAGRTDAVARGRGRSRHSSLIPDPRRRQPPWI